MQARQHFNHDVNWVERAGARVQIVRHQRVAARLHALDAAEQQKLEQSAESYTPEQRAGIDQRIWDPKIRALMGLPPLAQAR